MIEDTLDSPHIHCASSDNFASLVLENSRTGPVLVNFWSEKAGPCLRQYPILDKLVYHYSGRLLLINIDADTEVKITKEYGIASVPTLKLFRHGQIVETLHGYQSETDLQHMLDRHVARESDQLLTTAIKYYAQGEHAQAYAMISEAIVNDPFNPRLPLALCKLLKHEQRYQEAIRLISTLPENIAAHRDIIELQHQLEFLAIAAAGSSPEKNTAILEKQAVESGDYLELKKQLSAHYVVQQNYQQALATLVAIMEMDQNFDDQYARKAMLK
ncbi:MAG: tetratricopeptide repeat protein, partial [Gammaproteobacteria bacterium]|nr:tetratricopeptide repeat protein [Gammaproteobacteria bacterium]